MPHPLRRPKALQSYVAPPRGSKTGGGMGGGWDLGVDFRGGLRSSEALEASVRGGALCPTPYVGAGENRKTLAKAKSVS